MTLNPFTYGKAVPPKRFIGRRPEVRTIFSRVNQGDSTAVVGQPHVGKSSVLDFIAHKDTRKQYLGESDSTTTWMKIDCHQLFPTDFRPPDFWQQVFARVPEADRETLSKSGYRSFELADYFKQIAERGDKLVLLLDEVDALLAHPNFNGPEFLGALRSCASGSGGGLTLVTASRQSLKDMNRATKRIGSPFFNTLTEVVLRPLQAEEVDQLIDQTLAAQGGEVQFKPTDREYLRRVAGGHPYLVQAAASALFDSITGPVPNEERFIESNRLLMERTAAFFSDLWDSLTDSAKIVIALLALSDLEHRVTNARSFDISDTENLSWYGPELGVLKSLGLAAPDSKASWQLDWGGGVTWKNETWRIAADSFGWWVCQNPIADTRRGVRFEDWLHAREFDGLLTNEERDKVKSVFSAVVSKIPVSVIAAAWSPAEAFFKGIAKAVGQ